MKKVAVVLISLLFASSFVVYAQDNNAHLDCSKDGYTIATINGIFTDESGAVKNRDTLEFFLGKDYKGEPIRVEYLLNPSHLDGVEDLLDSAYQKYFEDGAVDDYDLEEMILSASQKVSTEKLLLVAHSQGNFYANSFYDLLADKNYTPESKGKIPAESIGVYAVATPASRVAGNGSWITSDNDRVIAGLVASLPGRKIMSPNTHIELNSADDPLGHSFSDVYLKYRAPEIIDGINKALSKLKTNDARRPGTSCIPPPNLPLGHKILGAALALADPIASASGNFVSENISGAFQVAGLATSEATIVGQSTIKTGQVALETSANLVDTVFKKIFHVINILTSALDSLGRSLVMHWDSSNQAAVAVSEPSVIVSTAMPSSTDKNIISQRSEAVLSPGPSILSADQLPNSHAASGSSTVSSNVTASTISPILVSLPTVVSVPTVQVAASSTQISLPSSSNQITVIVADVNQKNSSDNILPQSYAIPSGGGASNTSGSGEAASATESTLTAETVLATTTEKIATTTENVATTTPVEIIIPQTPNLISFSVSSCGVKTNVGGCTVATSTVRLSWTSTSTDIDFYLLNQNGNLTKFSSTTFSTLLNLPFDISENLSMAAYSTSGLFSATSSQNVYASRMPVVINEVAWGGTPSHPEDQWLELYNRSPYDIDLSGFALSSLTNSKFYINLSGKISSGGYYLVERQETGETNQTTEAPIKDVPAGVWASFGNGLSTTGDDITLSYSSTTVDELPYCWKWCGFSSSFTYERFDPDVSGTSTSNWASNLTFIRNGTNVSGVPIYGTPSARNSLNYLLNKNNDVTSDLTLKKNSSPYLVNNSYLKISKGVTLTIEPGVVIKFKGGAKLLADGNISANGTADDPIIFTSFADDAYGGDTNSDGSATLPAAGDWFGVELSSLSATSSFDNAIFRYGGNYGQGAYTKAMLYADSVSPPISNSIFEYSKALGLYLNNSSPVVSGNIFRYNSLNNQALGLYSFGGGPKISNNQFLQNDYGLSIVNSTGSVIGNTFTNNRLDAVNINNLTGDGVIAGNSGSGNLRNTIDLSGAAVSTGATTTLVSNPMPYFLSGTVTVPAQSALVIKDGTVVKSEFGNTNGKLDVSGRLETQGTTPSGIIFTSTAASTTPGSWWGIVMEPGSTSKLYGMTVDSARTGIKFSGSLIDLKDVSFTNNLSAVEVSLSTIFGAVNVSFANDISTTTPSGLW